MTRKISDVGLVEELLAEKTGAGSWGIPLEKYLKAEQNRRNAAFVLGFRAVAPAFPISALARIAQVALAGSRLHLYGDPRAHSVRENSLGGDALEQTFGAY